MTTFTLGEATALALGRVGGPASGRTPPVRRGSIEAGTFEDGFFADPARGECDRMLRAARAALDAGRRLKRIARNGDRVLSAAERALAALTPGAVRVFEEICTLARLNRGRVYPSYDRLAQATALGRATVARALACLEAAGFLQRQRRFRRIAGLEAGAGAGAGAGGRIGPGPRLAQTSNAYRPLLPARLAELLPRWLRPAPTPVDALQHEVDRIKSVAAMQAGLTCRELAQATTDGPLGQVLARLGTLLDRRERESHDGRQSLTSLSEPMAERVDRGRGETMPMTAEVAEL